MATKKCVVMDIETIPSHKAILDTRATDFALPVFHEIVCLSYAVLDDTFNVMEVRSLGLNRESERDVLSQFGKLMNEETLLVTWGGRRFDLPVILYRSMYYGIPCPWYFKRDFSHRYDLTGHIDLKDHMSLWGSTEIMKLDHIAAAIGLPGKMDVTGADVASLWAKNRFKEIGAYCVSDVVQTMVVFLRWSLLRGLASPGEFNQFLRSLSKYEEKLYLKEASEVSGGLQMVTSKCNLQSLIVDDEE